MRVVFGSARSSPGVTTSMLACASVWPGRVLLVEASEDGGALAARFGLAFEPGLTTVTAALRHEHATVDLAAHGQPLPGTDERIVALVGPPATEQARVLLRSVAARLDGALTEPERDGTVLVDVGRLSDSPLAAPLIASADRLVVVARPRIEELQALAHRLPALARFGPPPELLLVGERPYGATEIAATLGCRVVGVVADDPGAADALAAVAAGRRLSRSPLLRSAAGVVEKLAHPPATDASAKRPADVRPAGRVAVASANGAGPAPRWTALRRS